MAAHDIPYFRSLWQMNVSELENQCKIWEKMCSDNHKPLPDDVNGEIRTSVGLARLLMNQKLKQFKGLIDDSEFHTGEKEITCSDLEGFWDMVYFEVEKILKRFERLDKCKSNEWKFVEEISEKLDKKKIPIKKDKTNTKKRELFEAQRLAARQRIAEAKRKIMAERKEGKEQDHVEILQPSKEKHSRSVNLVDIGKVTNTVVLTDKIILEDSNKNVDTHKKAVILFEKDDANEESLNLNEMQKQKVAQKKQTSLRNKENVSLDDDSSNMKCLSSKLTKSKEYGAQVIKRTRTQNYGKLQCMTRSATKKAALLQQNVLQK